MLKSYEKPKVEMIELRPEERLASCGWKYVRPFFLLWFLGCYWGYSNGGGGS